MTATGTTDIVYTWVDDTFPGYQEVLRKYAVATADRNPNRTRDNLDLLKYSLRSLEKNLAWAGRVHIVSCSPQIPAWLNVNAPGLRIIHHDAFMPAEILPTFNSFAIVSSLAGIESLPPRFLYVEDDMLFTDSVSPDDFADAAGRPRFYPRPGITCDAGNRTREDISPWNRALANSNHLLDQAFGPARRHVVNHVPLLIDRAWWQEMMARWPAQFDCTRKSRFRATGNVAPEYLYPWFLHYTGRAAMASLQQTRQASRYVSLENWPFSTAFGLWRARRHRPKFLALNDGFGAAPRAGVVARSRAFLENAFPEKSRFER